MNTTKLKEALRLARESFAEAEPIKLEAQAKTADGAIIGTTGDSFAVGGDVYLIDGDEQPVALEPGAYIMEDGSTLTVEEAGMIAAIEPASEDGEEELSMTSLKEQFDKLEAVVLALVEALDSENLEEEKPEAVEELEEETEDLAKVELEEVKEEEKEVVPAVEPIQLKKENKTTNTRPQNWASMSMNDRIKWDFENK